MFIYPHTVVYSLQLTQNINKHIITDFTIMIINGNFW